MNETDKARMISIVLQLAATWSDAVLKEGFDTGLEEVHELLAEFADKVTPLRQKYEVSGPLLQGAGTPEVGYLDELNKLLSTYTRRILQANLAYLQDEESVSLMAELI